MHFSEQDFAFCLTSKIPTPAIRTDSSSPCHFERANYSYPSKEAASEKSLLRVLRKNFYFFDWFFCLQLVAKS